MEPLDESPAACCDGDCRTEIPRREFLRLSAFAAAGLAASSLPMVGQARMLARYVPMDKGLPSEWLASLKKTGKRAVYRGSELRFIGMPIGGICAGQVYLGGDGRLWLWDIFNQIKFGTVTREIVYKGAALSAGGGANYVQPPEQVHPFGQGFAMRVEFGGQSQVRTFDSAGWKDVSFSGEYPVGLVDYKDPSCPVTASLEAFSPFIPLDADDSGLPAVVMRFKVRNNGAVPAKVSLGAWIENPAGMHTVEAEEAVRTNLWSATRSRLEFGLSEPPGQIESSRPTVVFEDWEKDNYAGWTVAGEAFGPSPLPKAGFPSGDIGGPGTRFAKSYNIRKGENNVQGDAYLGKLTSREFTIDRNYIEFYIGGGDYPKTACLNLIVDGAIARTATGRREDHLRLERFNVRSLQGKRAHIEIVDNEAGAWGQIGVGQIAFTDIPSTTLREHSDFGEMTLALLDRQAADWAVHELPADDPAEVLFTASARASDGESISAPTPARPRSGLGRTVTLAPREEATVSFVVAWRFPNLTLSRLGKVGNFYASRFKSSSAVVDHIQRNDARLSGLTRLWHETWYDSTLPRWMLDRTMGNTSTLATMTCVRFGNGRFYAWEGIGCCDGTCGHVWQYAQTVGRLFPSLERSVREMVDYGVAFHPESGIIEFRGEYGNGYAADAQAGYILRTYREHQTSPDDAFLRRVYPKMKKALEFMIGQDADADGILEGRQHNTLDVDLYGPSSWLTSLYLAALRAGEEMARETGDTAFATRCRALFDKGSGRFSTVFWNGSYFVHRLKLDEHLDAMRIGDGCEIDQLMGQGWAWQVGLGRIADAKHAKAALKALYQNNFLADIGPFREKEKPGRWYALPGEAGLLMCTFPKGDKAEVLGPKPTWASMYFNECWTGSEYEAAGHMVAEGLVDEGLTVMRAVHERHHPAKRNPFNEVECSDHYARCLAVYGVFVAACGFEYHGPKGHIGFAPKVQPENFRAAFTAAEGWGTFRQKIARDGMQAGIKLRHGSLRLNTVSLEVPENLKGSVRAQIGRREVKVEAKRTGDRMLVTLDAPIKIAEGEELTVTIARA